MRASPAVALVFSLVLIAAPATADLTLGPIVTDGREIPVLADVNGDGLTDVVHDRDVLVNHGAGAFLKRSLGLGSSESAVDRLDANGDGRADLLTKDRAGSAPGSPPSKLTYRVRIADRGGAYGAGAVVPTDGAMPYIAEVDGDGREDLVLARPIFAGSQQTATELRVLLSKGDGTFAAREPFRIAPYPQYGMYHRLVTGDLDGDGHGDLVFRTPTDLIVLRGTGGGDFAPAESRYLPYDPFGGWCTALADVDSDGHLDILLAAQRTVRVFYGDGRGRFPRTSTTAIRKVHDAVIPPQYVLPTPPGLPPMTPDAWSQPRLFAFGQFVAKGRFEMAVGTGEGDVVVLAWENGALREVSRSMTELLAVDAYAGSFRERGRSDVYITWNYGYGENKPRPRILFGDASETAAPSREPRARAFRGYAGNPLTFDVQVTGDCVTASETWNLAREGIFAREQVVGRTTETVLENRVLFFRLDTSWSPSTVYGALHLQGRRYEGTVEMQTSCGWQFVTMVATPR